jgi:pyruvate,water dikinase
LRHRRSAADRARKAQAFLESFPPEERAQARELLELGRASYRLRDDDNLYLGRIERELWRAVSEGRRRLGRMPGGRGRLASSLQAVHYPQEKPEQLPVRALGQKDRQLVGQPAGDGLATGVARVVLETKDLFAFKRGEILVCDALDPNMTFVIPLAAAVVERRGGMLIHGAIIAREYGLPCVTGIPELTSRVPNGARITVDGYLGIVVLHDD